MSETNHGERLFLSEIDSRNQRFSPLRAALALSQAADPHRLSSAVMTVLLQYLPELDGRLKALGKPYQKLEALSDTFFGKLGFGPLPPGEGGLAAVELHRVTERRRGRPLSIGLLYYELARRLALPLRPLALPGGVLFASHWLPAGQVINPVDGSILPLAEARHCVELSLSGRMLALQPDSPQAITARQLLERYLVEMRAAALAEGQVEDALRAADWRVRLMPHSRRALWDRGLLLYRLDRYEAAEQDLVIIRQAHRRRRRIQGGSQRARAEVNHLLASVVRARRAS